MQTNVPTQTQAGDTVVRVVGAAILRGDTCLVAQRSRRMAEPLKWEFPGGKVEPGEGPHEALAREIREELNLVVEVGARLGRGVHVEAGRRVELDVYIAAVVSGEIHLAEHRQVGWFRAAQIDGLDWAAADLPVLAALKRRLRGRCGWLLRE